MNHGTEPLRDQSSMNEINKRVHYARDDADNAAAVREGGFNRSVIHRRSTKKPLGKSEKRVERSIENQRESKSRQKRAIRSQLQAPYENFTRRIDGRGLQVANPTKTTTTRLRPRGKARNLSIQERSVLQGHSKDISHRRSVGYWAISSESEDLDSPETPNLENSLNSMGCEVACYEPDSQSNFISVDDQVAGMRNTLAGISNDLISQVHELQATQKAQQVTQRRTRASIASFSD